MIERVAETSVIALIAASVSAFLLDAWWEIGLVAAVIVAGVGVWQHYTGRTWIWSESEREG